MLITVTQEHIDNGKPTISSSCPVALALIDAGFVRSRVGFSTYRVWKKRRFWFGDCSYSGFLPPNAIQFVRSFDGSQVVKPFTFEIELTKW